MAAELGERIRQAEREAENIERQGDEKASARLRQAGEDAAADRSRILDEAQSRRDEGRAAPGRRARPSDAPRRKRPRPLAES